MENITDNINDIKKLEEESYRRETEHKLLSEKEKERRKELKREEKERRLEKEREERKEAKRIQKEVAKKQLEDEKLLEVNEKLNKKRFDNDETYTWGELILREKSFITVEETKEIWLYSENLGYYTPNGEIFLMKLCADGGPRTNDPQVLRQLKMFIMGKSFKKIDEFIHPEHLINLKNGVIDMNKNELIPKSPHYNFQNVLNINYDKNADCPVWKETLMDMFKTPEDYERTQKWFGYHLLRENKDQVMHGYVGPSGCGKSTMLHLLVDVLGKENVTHFNLQDLNNRTNSYAIGRLYGKLANITFDMVTTPIKDGTFEILKNLTSCDRINARNIREAPFEFVPHAKLTFACNKLPIVADNIINTNEFKRRVMITEVVKKEDFVKDSELRNKFLQELHSGGIFNWILEGRKMYLNSSFGFNYDHENIPMLWNKNVDDEYKVNYEEIAKSFGALSKIFPNAKFLTK